MIVYHGGGNGWVSRVSDLSHTLAAQAHAGQDVLIHDPRLAHRQSLPLALPIAL